MAGIASTIQQKLGFSNQKALLLGAGFVTKPTVEILANAGVEVTIGELCGSKHTNAYLTHM